MKKNKKRTKIKKYSQIDKYDILEKKHNAMFQDFIKTLHDYDKVEIERLSNELN